MEELYNFFKENRNKKNFNEKTKYDIKYNKKLNIDFIEDNILNTINKSKFNLYFYTDNIKGIDINISIYNKVSYKKPKKHIQHLLWIINNMVNISDTNLESLDITIFLLKIDKIITEKNSIIGHEVNSGCSIINNKNNSILIWRLEEINKVLIHELIHSLSLDPIIYNTINEKKLISKFSYCPQISSNLFESYVEFWATIINLVFLLIDNNLAFIHLNKYIDDEINFSFEQVSKILKYYNINTLEDFYLSKKHIYKQDVCKFRERSSVFMYYFGKLLLLLNYNKVFSLCEKHSYYHIINIKSSSIFTNKIIKIMGYSLEDNRYKFNKYLENFKDYLDKINHFSLRMTKYG